MTSAPASPSDRGVAGYLGRVLDENGGSAGTCFQVVPGVLVTAWHVLEEIGAADEGAPVRLDPLPGGAPFAATVRRLDAVHDLAVMASGTSLPASAGSLAETDRVPLRARVSATSHALAEDADRSYQHLDAPGEWAGGMTRDDAVPLGCMTTSRITPGMSGAPVVRDADGVVVGVVSGRYNSAGGWLADSVWVARTEDLAPLLAGIPGVVMEEVSDADAVDLVFTVTADRVTLAGAGANVSARHAGVRPGLAEAIAEMRRNRANAVADAGRVALGRAGRLLAESFLPGAVATELGRVLRAAERSGVPVRFGVAVGGGLAGLPWEGLPDPVHDRPLALHPLVNVYRKVEAARPREVPGPLRIVVAIAAPEAGGGAVLDYERELRNVIAAVRSARQGTAHVRVVSFATPAAIYAALDAEPAHVLHVSGHGSPGFLDLENDDGSARRVSPSEFAEEALPPGKVPPVIVLAACYTDTAAPGDELSFAGRLCQRGAAVVIATETSVTDVYATRVFARVYGRLAQARVPDAVASLAGARREVQRQLAGSSDEDDRELAALDEWAVVTLLAASGCVQVFDPDVTAPSPAPPPPQHAQITGMGPRDAWYFTGRRLELRRWPRELTSPGTAGIVIYGIGGVGKTCLAAEVATRVGEMQNGTVVVSRTGPLTINGLFGAVTSALHRALLVRGQAGGDMMQAISAAARPDLGWQDRLAMLRDHVLATVPLLVVLDNFEDDLRPTGTTNTVRDDALAELLAAWASSPGRSRILVTSRHPFTLPGGAERALSFRQIGPLSRAETMKLAWSLPALDRLDPAQLDQVWRLAGGHPRSLEYLDALLAGGTARSPDITARLTEAVSGRLAGTSMREWLTARAGLDAALAEIASLAADEVLLGDLLARLRRLPGAEDLLLGVSVYQEPVDVNALLFQAGQRDETAAYTPDHAGADERIAEILAEAGITVAESLDLAAVPATVEARLAPHLAELGRLPGPPFRPPPGMPGLIQACQASSLLTVGDAGQQPSYFVHRWTATELAQRAGDDPRLTRAHQRAAEYWLWRAWAWPQDSDADLHDLRQARHHHLQAGETDEAAQVSEAIFAQLHTSGAWDDEESLIHDTLTHLPGDSRWRSTWIQRLGAIAQQRGDYAEAERQYQHALELLERVDDQAGVAAVYHNLGMLAQHRGDYDQAERRYQRALDISERLGNQAGLANTYGQLGALAQARGDYAEAEFRYQLALDTLERLGDQAGMATGHGQLGTLAQARSDYPQAERRYQRALEILERLGDQAGMARVYGQLGMLAQARGDYPEAEFQYQRAQEILERLGDQAGMATGYGLLGGLALLQGDYPEAERQYQRALEILERLGNQAGVAESCHRLGFLAQARGDYPEAERQYQGALEILERLGSPAGMATGYHALGGLAQARGDYPQAERQYQRALEIRERLGDQAAIAGSYGLLGGLAQARGDYPQAERQYQRALEISKGLGDQAGLASGYHALGFLAHLRGDYPEAERQYQRALDIFERLGDQADMAGDYSQLGILAQDRGDYPQAERQYQRALKIRERLGDEAGLADSYGQLGTLAQDRGDYPQAERQYRRALDIFERLGNQAGLADSYGRLGTLAHQRGDYPQAERQYRRALDIFERLGNPHGMAVGYSQVGILEADMGAVDRAIAWHVGALAIRLELGVPEAITDIRRLSAHRAALGPERFTDLLTEAVGDAGQAEFVMSLLDQADAAAEADNADSAE